MSGLVQFGRCSQSNVKSTAAEWDDDNNINDFEITNDKNGDSNQGNGATLSSRFYTPLTLPSTGDNGGGTGAAVEPSDRSDSSGEGQMLFNLTYCCY